MTIEQLCPDLQGGIGKVFPGQAVGTACSALQAPIGQTGVVPALRVSFAPYQRALQVLHPEAFARHLAGRVVSPGNLLGFLFGGRIRIDFVVTGCWPCAPAVRITSETTFDVDVNPVQGDQGSARELQEK